VKLVKNEWEQPSLVEIKVQKLAVQLQGKRKKKSDKMC
jgi:hypothetical protein